MMMRWRLPKTRTHRPVALARWSKWKTSRTGPIQVSVVTELRVCARARLWPRHTTPTQPCSKSLLRVLSASKKKRRRLWNQRHEALAHNFRISQKPPQIGNMIRTNLMAWFRARRPSKSWLIAFGKRTPVVSKDSLTFWCKLDWRSKRAGSSQRSMWMTSTRGDSRSLQPCSIRLPLQGNAPWIASIFWSCASTKIQTKSLSP